MLHNFLRCIIEYCQMSQFSGSKGQRFESPRPQQAAPIWALPFFVLYEILRGAARGDSNSPCPPPYVPAGKKAPAGLF